MTELQRNDRWLVQRVNKRKTEHGLLAVTFPSKQKEMLNLSTKLEKLKKGKKIHQSWIFTMKAIKGVVDDDFR